MTKPQIAETEREIVLVSAADEAYAAGLAVTIRSALDHLGHDRRLRLFVLDGGLSSATRERLESSWTDPRLTLHWTPIPVERVRDAPIDGHASPSVYSRLLMPELLPGDASKAIYLDSDVLVRRDLGLLWETPLDGHDTMAVRDASAPMIDSRAALRAYPCCRSYIWERPVANYRELGLAASSPYFNSGLLLVDVDRWRRERIGERAMDCLRENRPHVRFWDQYALNVVLAGRWGLLDPRWNQIAHLWLYPSWRQSPFARSTFETMRSDPWIVHFTSAEKPWLPGCDSPYRQEFMRVARRTAWSGLDPDGQTPPSARRKLAFKRRRRAIKKWLRTAPYTRPWATSPALGDADRVTDTPPPSLPAESRRAA